MTGSIIYENLIYVTILTYVVLDIIIFIGFLRGYVIRADAEVVGDLLKHFILRFVISCYN